MESLTKQLLQVHVGQALQVLQLLQRWSSASFPAKDAYLLGRVTARLQSNPDLVAADQARMAAVRKFGVGKDGSITVHPDKLEVFSAEYGPVAMTQLELDIPRLPVSILEHAPDMTPAEMMMLEPFIEGS